MSPADLFLLPAALPLLLLAPLAFLLLRALDRRRAKRLRRAVGRRAAALAGSLSPGARRARRALFSAALLLGLLAVCQPAAEDAAARAERRLDLVVCLDVSRSMLARDVVPSRLERAREEIARLARRAGGDRMALVVFAGEARLVVPLTRDLRSLAEMASRAGILSVSRGGTDLGAALDRALAALETGTGRQGAVLLLSDGDDLSGRGLAAAGTCRRRGVPVYCVGFGSARGAKIPVETGSGEKFLTDRTGEEVVSALDLRGLRRIAAATGGEVATVSEEEALVPLYEARILPAARASAVPGGRRERENRFQWPLAAAIVLWILESCLSERRRRRR